MHSFQSCGHDGSPFLLPHHAGWIDVVDVWDQSPLAVSGMLCGLDGKKAKVPSTPHTIPDMGFKWVLWFSV
jgi:hypothetical protein